MAATRSNLVLGALAMLMASANIFIALRIPSISKYANYSAKAWSRKSNKKTLVNDREDDDDEEETSLANEMDLNQSISTYAAARRNNSIASSRIIWQKWTTRDLPSSIEYQWKTRIMKQNPTYEHRVFGDLEASEFMKQYFRGPTADAFESTNPAIGAMRADMWRYCVLYKYGGVYLDADADLPITRTKHSTTTLDQWIQDRAILSVEGNPFDTCVQSCTDIWASINRTFPSSLAAGNRAFLQWMLVFPKPGHVILWETIRLFTSLVTAWNDTGQSQEWHPAKKVVCLTGPCMFSVAVENAFVAANGDWDNLDVDLMGTDYEGKAIWENPQFKAAMNAAIKPYGNLGNTVALKQDRSDLH